MKIVGQQDLECSENDSFAVFFMHLKLGENFKENYTGGVGESKVGIGLQDS